MTPLRAHPVVHLELHTGDLPQARALYAELCAGAVWLPYVEVSDVPEATGRARKLGASVLLAPREGPAGWRSVVVTPCGGEIAFWRSKARGHDAP